MKNFKQTYPIVLIVLIFLLQTSCKHQKENAPEETPKSPNILMISIDDLNGWLGCLDGHPNAKTPNIDRLAASGVLFSNAHCQAPLCGPSRTSLMTGLRPTTTGVYGHIQDNDIRKDNPRTKDVTFLPEYFKNEGYHTMGIGKIFHIHAPDSVFNESGGRYPGFGPKPAKEFVWDGRPGKDGKRRTNTDWGAFPENDSLMPDVASTNWAIERLNRDYDKPFFMAVGFLRPHVPWYVPQKWFDLHPIDSIQTPPYKSDDWNDIPSIVKQIDELTMMPTTEWAIENGEWKNIIQAYLACISFVDHYVGEILKTLEKSKYADNTIVVLWSDHGYRIGEKGTFAKHCLWDEGTSSVLMFSGPGIESNVVTNKPAELLSIYPTLVELSGLPKNSKNEGISLVPVLKNEQTDILNYALSTHGFNNHSIRTEQYRYIQYEDGTEEFYDHETDPNEFDNLAKAPQHQERIAKLKKLIPQEKAPWAKHSKYGFNQYFINDKIKHSEN